MPQLHNQKFYDIGYLVFRNVFLLINIIIFAVVGLLFYFGDTQDGIFLGIIICINTIIGITQEIHAWLTLEKLNLLTASRVVRLSKDEKEELVLPEEIRKDDRIKLKLGDQVPCDGVLISTQGMEVNEALITGESHSFLKSEGGNILAGSIITAGSGLMSAESTYKESRIAKMTEGIKRYSNNMSPIQRSINKVVKYSGYVLLVVIAFVVARGLSLNEPALLVVKNIGALASILVPQGLVIATTLLFAYGAVHFFRKHVLLQEMNATEKLGRIKNLCMDKTGTLTENLLTVEGMYIPEGALKQEAEALATAYVSASTDSSETIRALEKFLNQKYVGEVGESLPFSSLRKYGGILIKSTPANTVIFAGAPEVFIPHIVRAEEKQWLQGLLDTHAPLGKRVLCLVRLKGVVLPQDLSGTEFSVIAVFVLNNNLREGTHEAIDFFQNRGVRIRILSGDNEETVRSVVISAGIKNDELIITGDEMEKWSEADFDEKAKQYTIFARIKPEQKEKIIEALKKDGFTAMVGDGANDALAIKKADLGIAMFDGAPATRQLASVVLTNNSFAELPGGVKLADNIIENIEIFASIFFNQIFLGFFLFAIVSILGYVYPFAPLNITLINYFTIGIPGLLISYWAVYPQEPVPPANQKPFLERVVLFPFVSSILQSFAVAVVFVWSLQYLKSTEPNTLVVIAFIVFGFIFFLFAPSVYSGAITRAQRIELFSLAVIELALLFFGFKITWITEFFSVSIPPLIGILQIILITAVYGCLQFALTKMFFASKKGEEMLLSQAKQSV